MLSILLPTDFSTNSWNAIVYAIHLFENVECKFHLFNCYTTEMYHLEEVLASPGQLGLGDVKREESLQRLEEFRLRLSDEFAKNDKHLFETVTRYNYLISGIKELVEEREIDFIVMGTKGETNAKELLFGSNTAQVVKHINCPIIAIPSQFKYQKTNEILFTTDYHRFYSDKELGPLKTIAQLYEGHIRVLHISTEEALNELQKYNMVMLKTYLKNHHTSFHFLPNSNKKSKVIETYITDTGIDILIMVKYEHSLIETIFNEPIIEKLLFHPTIPILIIPDESKIPQK